MVNRLHCKVLIFLFLFTYTTSYWSVFGEFNEKEKFVTIQIYLHWVPEIEDLRFIADAVHSRGLKATWYVPPTSDMGMKSEVAAQLKEYQLKYNDDIQLSFSQLGFFNLWPPKSRERFIGHTMLLFKRLFGYYPKLICAPYIDAFSLQYITTNFPSVKGGVVFCNHEVLCDYLESKGGYYMPYYPSKFNTMVPAVEDEKLDFVAMPFIMRDLTNCIKEQTVVYNLNPQDYLIAIDRGAELPDRPIYFSKLFDAYINGWDEYGLVTYMVVVPFTYEVFESPCKELFLAELDYIKSRTSQDCKNILDSEFIDWFRSRFSNSPSYRWRYRDPKGSGEIYDWFFNPQKRSGYIDGKHFETRVYTHYNYEPCYNTSLQYYGNNMELSQPIYHSLPIINTNPSLIDFFDKSSQHNPFMPWN